MHVKPIRGTSQLLGFTCLLLSASLAFPVADADAQTTRLIAGPTAVRDAQGDLWQPAGRQVRGKRTRSWRWPGMTASPKLYRTVADGSRGIRPLIRSEGRYAITLVTVNPTLRKRSAGATFDVFKGRQRVYAGVRVPRGKAKSAIPVHTSFEITLKKGRQFLRFRARKGRPAIAAVQITRLGPVSTAPLRTVVDEQFDGPVGNQPDPARWRTMSNCDAGPGQLQCYTARPANVALDGRGQLDLIARREDYLAPTGHASAFTSGRIESEAAFSLSRARIRAHIKIPAGRGLWSVFWALGARPVVWPDAGEVDIMEMLGQKPRDLHAFVHGRDDKGNNGITQNGADHRAPAPLSRKFHTYEMRTVPGVAEFLIDGQTYGSVAKADLAATGQWPLDKQFNLIFSLSVGGTWPGPPDATTPLPGRMSIQSLQVYG